MGNAHAAPTRLIVVSGRRLMSGLRCLHACYYGAPDGAGWDGCDGVCIVRNVRTCGSVVRHAQRKACQRVRCDACGRRRVLWAGDDCGTRRDSRTCVGRMCPLGNVSLGSIASGVFLNRAAPVRKRCCLFLPFFVLAFLRNGKNNPPLALGARMGRRSHGDTENLNGTSNGRYQNEHGKDCRAVQAARVHLSIE
jgi:hypothetical protein